MRMRANPGATLLVLLLVAVVGGVLGSTILPSVFPQYFATARGQVAPAVPAPAGPPPDASAVPNQGSTRVIQSEESTIIAVVDRVRPAVVNIDTVAQVQTFFGLFPQQGAGSGVIVSPDGYVLTNNHVVEGAQQIKVTLLSGRSFSGRVIGTDPFADLAVVKVDAPERLIAAQLGNSSSLKVGQLAIAIGNPFGLGSTVTVGVISALNRNIQLPNLVVENLIQTDAAINPGNSGGALVNSSGNVIGINTAIVPEARGIGFAIPIDTASAIMQQLIRRGQVIRPYVGVGFGGNVDRNLAQQYNLPVDHGVIVRDVDVRGPSAAVGIKAGDIIVAVDGKTVNNWNDFIRELFTKQPGDRIRLEVVRDREHKTFDVTLVQRPK